jgi:hypothetical protein
MWSATSVVTCHTVSGTYQILDARDVVFTVPAG